MFAIFDKDGDGYLSHAELKEALHKMGEKFTDEEIEHLIREADLDRDGEINYREFKRVIADPNRSKSTKR